MYSAPLPTGRPTTNRSAAEKHAVPAAYVSVRSDPRDDTSIWTASDTSGIPQPWIQADTNYSWDPDLLDLDPSFDPGWNTNAPLVAGLECANTTYLPTTDPTKAHPAGLISIEEPRSGRLPSLWSPPSSTDTTESCIKQLSDLSIRLYLVYKTSCKLAAAQEEHPGVVLSSLAFETFAAYLQADSTLEKPAGRGCKALDELFCATRSLLDVLHDIEGSTVSPRALDPADGSAAAAIEGESPISIPSSEESPLSAFFSFSPNFTASSPSTRNTSLVGSTTSDTPPLEATAERLPLPAAGAPGPDGVILHLILACYTRLLHIYHNIIMALHCDAAQLRETESGSQSSLSGLRLVLFVQLITHLLDRLRKAMDNYHSLLMKRNRTDCMNVAIETTSQTRASTLDAHKVGLGDVTKLETVVRHELQQLQKKSQNL